MESNSLGLPDNTDEHNETEKGITLSDTDSTKSNERTHMYQFENTDVIDCECLMPSDDAISPSMHTDDSNSDESSKKTSKNDCETVSYVTASNIEDIDNSNTKVCLEKCEALPSTKIDKPVSIIENLQSENKEQSLSNTNTITDTESVFDKQQSKTTTLLTPDDKTIAKSLSSSVSDLVIITDENREVICTDDTKPKPDLDTSELTPNSDESDLSWEKVDFKTKKSLSNYELSTNKENHIDEVIFTETVNSVETVCSEEVLSQKDLETSSNVHSEKLGCETNHSIKKSSDDSNEGVISTLSHGSPSNDTADSHNTKTKSTYEDTNNELNDSDESDSVSQLDPNMTQFETSQVEEKNPEPDTKQTVGESVREPETNLRRRGIHEKEVRDGSEDDDEKAPPLEEWEREKVRSIMAVVRSAKPDREALKQLAIGRGGLLNNRLRSLAWPVLLGVDVTDISPKPEQEELKTHRDYEQVVLDVNRSLKRFPPGMEEDVRLSMQDQLVDCIMRVLCARSELHYYQGYHDIVVTFLLVLGEDITFALMNELSMKHLRDFMYENMDKTTGMLHYLYPLLGKSNSKLRAFMEQAEVGTIFALAWLITWFGHVLGNIRHIVRLYDFFIACHPLMPIYLAAAIVLHRADEILMCPPEMPIIHCLLSKIPPDLPIERLIREAGDLFVLYPPGSLEKEAKVQYDAYLAENERKRAQLQELSRARAARGRHKRSNSWWGSRGGPQGHQPGSRSNLVKVTVWTSAALLSAAAMTYYISRSSNVEHMFDFHWLWSG